MPDYVDVLRATFVDLWASAIEILPRIVLAIVIFLLGLLIASVLETAIIRLSKMLKLDELLEKLEIRQIFNRIGLNMDFGVILGWIAKWFVIILALIIGADTLGWDEITLFLTNVVSYIPSVLIAVIIMLVGLVLGNVVQKVVSASLEAAKMMSAGFISGIAKWSIIVFSIMAALVQLGIAESLIETLFTGFVAMIAIAGGLAFGLGGKDHAARMLDYIKKDLTSKDQQ
ncbi:MAG: hypothetical protein WCT24_03195 [Patescibacteria group bacterium]